MTHDGREMEVKVNHRIHDKRQLNQVHFILLLLRFILSFLKLTKLFITFFVRLVLTCAQDSNCVCKK